MKKSLSRKLQIKYQYVLGFTIVELLVVIVVIGILASLTIVSFSGISTKATVASVKSDLDSASKTLKMYYITYASYPSALDVNLCPSAPTADTNYCLQPSTGNTFTYSTIVPMYGYRLVSSNGTVSYSINDNTAPAITTTPSNSSVGSPCPSGYIPVPGSGAYNTNDFCVMKYEAKILGDDNGNQVYNSAFVPDSRMTGTPWVNISQTNAITEAAAACTGCHLITEAEWMTIAQNVLSVPSNWNGGVVGTSYIFSGHNDANPANPIAAGADNDPYNGTGQSSPSNQKRTLTLTNGEVIWDMSGNASEWTNATSSSGQQPGIVGESGLAIKEWNNVALVMNGLASISQPSFTHLSSITWNSSAGIGQLYSYYSDVSTRGYRRGGASADFNLAGIMALFLTHAPSATSSSFGFRVVL